MILTEGMVLEYTEIERLFDRDMWVDINWELIPLNEMNTKCIAGALKMIKSNGEMAIRGWGLRWKPKLEAELNRRKSTE